jgi:hypothetical protein
MKKAMWIGIENISEDEKKWFDENRIGVIERCHLGRIQPRNDEELDRYVTRMESEAREAGADIIVGQFDAPVQSIIGMHVPVGGRPTFAMMSPWWAKGEFVKMVYLGRI